jgi:putative nucleotidyltransferase with HDIG domain
MEKLMTTTLEDSYSIVCNVLGEALEWDYVEIWLRHPQRQTLYKSSIFYAANEIMSQFSNNSEDFEFAYGEGVPGKTWEAKKSIWYDDIRNIDYFIRKTDAEKIGLTTCFSLPIKAYDHVDAVLMFFNKEVKVEDELMLDLLNLVAARLGAIIVKSQIEEEIRDLKESSKTASSNTFLTIARVFSFRDPYTVSHQNLVTKLAIELARKLHLSDEEIHDIQIASMLHDIGKIGVPMEILSKPNKLSVEEFDLVKSHARIGANIVEDLPCSRNVKLMVLEHHERLDGSGYPDKKKGDQIYIGSQLIAVADVVSAMLENRPYRSALKLSEVKDELTKYSGIKYNQVIVGHTLEILDQIH